MFSIARTYIIRELSDSESDGIVEELQRVERAGHRIADIRHEGGVWRIFAHDRRRLHDGELMGASFYRRRKDD